MNKKCKIGKVRKKERCLYPMFLLTEQIYALNGIIMIWDI